MAHDACVCACLCWGMGGGGGCPAAGTALSRPVQFWRMHSSLYTPSTPSTSEPQPLTTLQLYLWDNPIGGTLPPTNWLPPGLQTLELSRAQLVGTIPGKMALPGSLLTLDLNNNSLTGAVPNEWATSMPRGLRDLRWVGGWVVCWLAGCWGAQQQLQQGPGGCSRAACMFAVCASVWTVPSAKRVQAVLLLKLLVPFFAASRLGWNNLTSAPDSWPLPDSLQTVGGWAAGLGVGGWGGVGGGERGGWLGGWVAG